MSAYSAPTLLNTLWLRDKDEAKECYSNFMSAKHFRSLDGLRCLSILAVIWHHTAGDLYPADSMLFMGHHGVTLFFVISGFLITTLLVREKQRFNTISLAQFYIRRTLRIFPVYYLVLLIYCALVFVLEKHSAAGKSFFDNLIYFATYTSNYFVQLNGDRVIFYFAWSLAAEEQFYMVWPAIEKWLNEKSAILMALLFILLATLALNVYLPIDKDSLLSIILEHIAIPICVGVLLAHMMNHEKTFTWLYQLTKGRFMPLVILVSAVYMLTLPEHFLLLAFMLLSALIFCAVTRKTGVLDRVFNLNGVKAIGKVSYGMYLFHMLALNVSKRLLSLDHSFQSPMLEPLMLFLVTSILSFVIAQLSFRYFEVYFLRLKQDCRPYLLNSGAQTSNKTDKGVCHAINQSAKPVSS